MKYEWTDWITHTPGQELPVGLYVLFEFLGARRNGGQPYTREGVVSREMRGHHSWHATTPNDGYCMVLRYKLRCTSAEQEQSAELETV